jgi:hypothetical protein
MAMRMSSSPTRTPFLPVIAALLAALFVVNSALAQQPDARASREREMLRRAQAALQQASGERDALQAEKATLLQERDTLKQQTERGADELRGSKAEAAGRKAETDRLQAALSEAQRTGSAQKQAGDEREAALRSQLAGVQRELADRSAANRQLAALLERQTGLLTASEERNRGLHAIGHELLALWLTKTPIDNAVQNEPFFGLREVAMQDRAETLRARIDALLTPTAAPRPAPSP